MPCDIPYNIRRPRNMFNPDYNLFTTRDYSDVIDEIALKHVEGGHAPILCSLGQQSSKRIVVERHTSLVVFSGDDGCDDESNE